MQHLAEKWYEGWKYKWFKKNLTNFWGQDWLLLNTVKIRCWVRKSVTYWFLKTKHTVFCLLLLSSYHLASLKKRVLSIDTTSFWPSVGLLMLSQMPLNCMALAQASEACCILLILVRAVESWLDDVRNHSACREEVSLPSSLPALSTAPYTSFFFDPIMHLWGSVTHLGLGRSLSASKPWVKQQFIFVEIACLVLLLIYIQALYLSNAFHPRIPQHSVHQHLFAR